MLKINVVRYVFENRKKLGIKPYYIVRSFSNTYMKDGFLRTQKNGRDFKEYGSLTGDYKIAYHEEKPVVEVLFTTDDPNVAYNFENNYFNNTIMKNSGEYFNKVRPKLKAGLIKKKLNVSAMVNHASIIANNSDANIKHILYEFVFENRKKTGVVPHTMFGSKGFCRIEDDKIMYRIKDTDIEYFGPEYDQKYLDLCEIEKPVLRVIGEYDDYKKCLGEELSYRIQEVIGLNPEYFE